MSQSYAWCTDRTWSRSITLTTTMMFVFALSACSGQSIDQISPPPPPPPPPPPSPPAPPPPPSQVTAGITVDTLIRYQVMTGWEAVTQSGQDSPGFFGWQQALMDLAANDLGLNRVRLEIRSGAENPVDSDTAYYAGTISEGAWKNTRYVVVNDNANPNLINPAGFHFTALDRSINRVVLPLRQRLAARGEHLYVNLNYVSFGPNTNSPHLNAAEYAEFMLAVFQHMQSSFGFVPDAVEIILEPDNNTPWRGTLIGQAIAATGGRLAAAGFTPEFIAPSTMSMASMVPYLNEVAAVPGALTYLKEVAYHRYRGVSDANLAAIRTRATQLGLRTAMLEHIGSGVEDLYKDLTIANVSAWQQFTLAFPTSDNGAQYYTITNGQPVMGSRTRALRQYFRYVRQGARRIDAFSNNAGVRSVGFINTGGGPVVVLHADGMETFAVRGLRPGRYLITSANPSAVLPTNAVAGADGELRFTAISGVHTVAWQP